MDLTQDTFVDILEKIGELEEPVAFVTWAKQIAYHKCTGYFRKKKELLLDENEDGTTAFDIQVEDNAEFIPDEALDNKELKQTILAMINELPEEQRAALLLRYFNEIPVKEIAQIQNVSEGTIKSRLNYARKSIKQAIETYEKKNGIKLHCVGVLPLLLWVFREYRVTNKLSMAAGTAALRDNAYYMNNCETIKENRAYTERELTDLGFRVLPSKTNFVFAESDKVDGATLYTELRKRGILVRHFTLERIKNFNRITIGTLDDMKAFIAAVKEIIG